MTYNQLRKELKTRGYKGSLNQTKAALESVYCGYKCPPLVFNYRCKSWQFNRSLTASTHIYRDAKTGRERLFTFR